MNTAVDLTFFCAVKKAFQPKEGSLLFIHVQGTTIEELVCEEFRHETLEVLERRVHDSWDIKTPYFVINAYDPGPVTFFYACREFLQEEEYYSGKVTHFELNPFRNIELDIEKLKRELEGLKEELLSDKKSKVS